MTDKPDHSELVNRILTGARWATVLRLAAQVFSWLSTIIVVRFISPQDYGLNSMLESPLVLMMMVSTLGLDSALVQARRIETKELQSIFGWLLILNGILFLCYFFGGPLLAFHFDEPRLDLLAKALAFIFLLVPFRVIPNALLDRQLDFKLRAQLEIAATVVAAIVTLALAYAGAGVWALVSGVIVGKLLLSVLLMTFKPWLVVPRFDWAITGPIMSTGGIITVSGALLLLSDLLITLVAGPKLGAALLGIFAVGAQFASLPLAKGMPIINQTMLPAFAKFQEHRSSATYYLEKFLGVASLTFFPMMTGMAAVADMLVLTVLGSKWAPSILPLTIMSLGMTFRMNNMLVKTALTSMGRADLALGANLLQVAQLLPLTIFAMEYGVTELAVAWVTTEFSVMLATVQMSKRVFDTSLVRLLRCYRPAVISSLIMAGCVIGIKTVLGLESSMAALLTAVATGILSYYLATRLLFPRQLDVTLRAILGERLAFLAPRREQS